MKIVIENLSDGETIPHKTLLVRGRVDNLDSSLLEESEEEWLREKAGFFATPLSPVLSTGPKRLFATIKTEESGRYNLVECIKLSPDGKFKIFVQLKNGLNWLNFEFCRVVRHLVVNCSAKYAQVEQSHKVKLVYIVSSDSNGEFQTGSRGHYNGSISSALARISLAGSLIQSFLSDSLDAHGLGRKTIQFAQNYDENDANTTQNNPSVFVLKSKLPSKDAHQMSQNDLWTYYAKELLNVYCEDQNVKYLAITNVTKYENPKRLKVLDYDHVLSMTKGHIALGGGGLALFGSGCLYSWPEKLSDVPRALKDQTLIDTDFLMDDSAYRGTYGGCFSTTLGALVHELGHSLDLGHTENGIMARGFDDMDRFFSICPNTTATQSKSEHLIMRRNSLRKCGAVPKLTPTQEKSMRSGQIRRKENGSNILEEYQKRKYYRKMVQDCGGAYWSRSCAIILSNHKWLNKDLKLEESSVEYDTRTKSIMSQSEEGICVVEFRDSDGNVIHFEEPEFSETTGRKLHKVVAKTETVFPKASEIVAADFAGNIFKGEF